MAAKDATAKKLKIRLAEHRGDFCMIAWAISSACYAYNRMPALRRNSYEHAPELDIARKRAIEV
jgi:hypothetical protein